MNWNQVHFNNTCYTFPGVLCSHVFPRDTHLCSALHVTWTHTHSLCWRLSWVCSVGLEGPAALSMVCMCVTVFREWMCMCMHLRAFGFSLSTFHLSLSLHPIKNACHFSMSLCMHSITLNYQSFCASAVPKVCLSALHIKWHLQSVFSQGFSR